jgi:hypothetical protein
VVHALIIFLSYACYHILLLLLFFIIKRSRIIFLDHQIQVLGYILELYGILGRKMNWLEDFTRAYLE